jgi:hypothetical protein
MITLKDSVEIKTSPEKLYGWFSHLDENFVKWHPNHKKFVSISGGLDEGDTVYFEECVEGKWYRVRVIIGKLEKTNHGWRIEFVTSSRMAKIVFIGESSKGGCIFSHIESFGIEKPVIGCFVDFLMSKIFYSLFRFDLIQKDMAEDGVNLKRLLERG